MALVREQLLLISSDSLASSALVEILQHGGYAVSLFSQGQAALAWLARQPAAMVIIGEQVEEGPGLDFVRQFSARYPQIPWAFCLSENAPERFKQGLRAGAADFLTPPFDAAEIIETVSRIVAQTQRQSLFDQALLCERALQETSAGLIIALGEELRVQLINSAAREAFDLAADTAWQGQPFFDVFPQPELENLFREDAENCYPLHRAEITLRNRIYSIQAAKLSGAGWLLTLQEITQLRKLEQIKTEIVHTISHDLRSPLTVILGYVELIERVGPVNELQKDFIRRSRTSVHNVTRLVDNFLQLTRIESDFENCKEPVDLAQTLQQVIDGFKKPLTEKKLHLQVDLPQSFPLVLANPVQMRQMLDNLLDNAIKYNQDDGQILVHGRVEGEQLILQIQDTGIGIPADEMTWIFDRFYRASNVSAEIMGSGLGLAIVQVIVANHEGRVWVESTPNEGTTVSILLPCLKNTAQPPATLPGS